MKVYAAINAVQAALSKDGIEKSQKNVQQGYRFRGIDDVMNALAPILATSQLCILPRVMSRECTERQTKSGGALFYTVLSVEYDFVHAEDGSTHTVRMCGEAMDSADKSSNKAASAAYKYACLQTFCIPTEGEDADFTTHEVVPAAPPAAPVPAVVVPDGYQVWLGKVAKIAATGYPALEAVYRAAPQDYRDYLRLTNAAELDRLKQVARDATTAAAAPAA